jgi:hypothetical protein
MPLIHGWSRAVVSSNVSREMEAGRPQSQAVAIALSNARRDYRRRHPVGPFPKHLRMTSAYRTQRSNRAGHIGGKKSKKGKSYGGSVRVLWSPVRQQWFVTWGDDLSRATVLKTFDDWKDAHAYATEITSGSANRASGSTWDVYVQHGSGSGPFQTKRKKLNIPIPASWDNVDAAQEYAAKKLRVAKSRVSVQPAMNRVGGGTANRVGGRARKYYVVDQVQAGHWQQVGHFYRKEDAVQFAKEIGGRTKVTYTWPAQDHPALRFESIVPRGGYDAETWTAK